MDSKGCFDRRHHSSLSNRGGGAGLIVWYLHRFQPISPVPPPLIYKQMTKESKIERTPAEIEAINKAVDAKRATAPKAVEVKMNEPVKQSKDQKAFAELIERYKVQNPVKYQAKKEALEAQLKNLK